MPASFGAGILVSPAKAEVDPEVIKSHCTIRIQMNERGQWIHIAGYDHTAVGIDLGDCFAGRMCLT
jgi:hypothetical protein